MGYGRRLGLSHENAQDVLQETMVTLMRLLPDFIYDPHKGLFRNFLLTIVHRKALARLRRIRRESEVPFATPHELPEQEGRDQDEIRDEEIERWRESLMEEALRRLKDGAGVDKRTVDVFFRYVVDRNSAAAVALEFGLRENAVYQIKNRLLRRLQADVANLMSNSGS